MPTEFSEAVEERPGSRKVEGIIDCFDKAVEVKKLLKPSVFPNSINVNFPPQVSKRYQTTYTEDNIKRAFWLVRTKKTPIRRAAWRCGVPVQTLRDRLSKGRDYYIPIQGAPTLFTKEEERKLVEHIMKLSACGYPLSRREVITLATESAELLGTRAANGNQLSKRWFERFMRRWPQLRLAKAQKLSLKRAKATSKETVEGYFKELEKIFVKYELTDKPHLIYNVDETGFQTEYEPTKVAGGHNQRLNSITSEGGAITIVLGWECKWHRSATILCFYREE
ncbi:hypothetical protein HOLleu_42460 [Holothuria leucospilota]|uniref:HTH CENPB-type domain-containing protein n=1 Tax=Holothuria leucospilota TaxID=206669 RepID=A0A9Q1BA49_HOLLE|nr:hypothetical protein HOLleu_42460 [Holothuria leucospilota]